jgi:hypothetical protein
LSPLIMSSDHVFLFVTAYYAIWSSVPFCHYLLCHLVICSLLSLLIMSSGHMVPFFTTYYVIRSCVPLCHYLLCHLVTCSLFVTIYYVIWPCVPFCHHLLCTQVICFLLSLLIMLYGHMFPFCHHLLCHLAMCSLLSPLIMYSGHVSFCHYLLCYLVTCSLFVTTYYVIWPCVPFCHHLLCTQVICFLLSPLVRWPYITLHLASHFYYVRLLYAMLLLNLMRSCGHMPRYLMQHLSLYVIWPYAMLPFIITLHLQFNWNCNMYMVYWQIVYLKKIWSIEASESAWSQL